MNKGRRNQTNYPQRRRLGVPAVFFLGVLLVMPLYALSRLSDVLDWRMLCVPAAMSVCAFFAYRSDKQRAETGEWRVPESTLHIIALIGGWPGAFLGQRVFRHKTSKQSFQLFFWLTVLLHQFAAVDSLLKWRLTKALIHAVKSQVN